MEQEFHIKIPHKEISPSFHCYLKIRVLYGNEPTYKYVIL